MYIFARYFGIVVQVYVKVLQRIVLSCSAQFIFSFNLYLVFGPLHKLYTPEHVCKQWFLFLIVSASALNDILDILLMLRG